MTNRSALATRNVGAVSTLLGVSDSLQNLNTQLLDNGCWCYVADQHAHYELHRDSTAASNPPLVIVPSSGPGRWVVLSSGGSGLPVATTKGEQIVFDGAAYVALDTPYSPNHANGSSGATITVDFSTGPDQSVTLTANCTLTAVGFVAGVTQWAQLKVTQDGTGSRALVIASAKTPGGAGLTLSTSAGAIDLVSLYWDGASLFATVAGLGFV